MLLQLSISNYAIIDQLNWQIGSGLQIITGETGAGKSILVGALGLILGERADLSILRDKEKKAVVEATFDVSSLNLKVIFDEIDVDFESETIIRREISPKGKSRAFINDTPVTLADLKTLTNHLIDLHRQHDTLSIAGADFQLNTLDQLAETTTLRLEFETKYKSISKLKNELKKLENAQEQFQKDQDYWQFQFNELAEMKLDKINQKELEEELQTLENAEQIKSNLFNSVQLLSEAPQNIKEQINEIQQNLRQIASTFSPAESYQNRIESVLIELEDIGQEIEQKSEQIEPDEERLEVVQQVLNELFRLQSKHNCSSAVELITLQETIEQKLDKGAQDSSAMLAVTKQIESAQKNLDVLAKKLTKERIKAVPNLNKNITAQVQTLGMEKAQFEVKITSLQHYNSTGGDEIVFLFAPNAGHEAKPLAKVASGGELSRLMLCIKTELAGKGSLSTLLFDEIDTGISGEVARKTGKKLQELAQFHQVLVITHSPQIASLATDHTFVYKQEESGRVAANMRQLTQSERVEEIAKMLSGNPPSDGAIQNAKELIGI